MDILHDTYDKTAVTQQDFADRQPGERPRLGVSYPPQSALKRAFALVAHG